MSTKSKLAFERSKKDAKQDKRRGIKEGSPADERMDAKLMKPFKPKK